MQPDARIFFPAAPDGMARWLAARHTLEEELGESITLDALTGPVGLAGRTPFLDDGGNEAGWLIAQRRRGHRHSIDDVLTAWYALQNSPRVSEFLDLGTGIGTVGLLTLWGMGEPARMTCVEAQEISFRLLRANLDANGIDHRVNAMHGDLRSLSLGRKFPLISGSPPYFPADTGVMPQDSQKAHARFELRGDVSDYAKTAANHLTAGGWFVLCFPAPQKARALSCLVNAGLVVIRVRDVIPRRTLAPLFSLFACRHASVVDEPMLEEPDLIVREICGKLTAEMAAVRRTFGFRDGAAHGGHSA